MYQPVKNILFVFTKKNKVNQIYKLTSSIYYSADFQSNLERCFKKYFFIKIAVSWLVASFLFLSLLKKWSFPLRISAVNVTKSAGNCRFGHIY